MKFWPALLPLALAACNTTSSMRDTQPTAPPVADEAKVIVYRTAVFGGAAHFPVYDDVGMGGRLMGFTETGCYFEYRCPPGRHLFFTWGEGEAFIEADLLPGRTYVIRACSRFGLISPRPVFSPVGRGSKEWESLEALLAKLQCREIDPSEVEAIEERQQRTVLQIKSSYSREEAKVLEPDDGLGELVLPAK